MGKFIKKGLIIAGIVVVVLLLAAVVLYQTMGKISHTEPDSTPAPVEESGDKVLDAMHRGVEFLKLYQEEDGHFSKGALDPKPAITAMVVDAILSVPHVSYEDSPYLQEAVQAIVDLQQPDGGFYTPRVPIGNYCTSVSLMALARVDKEKYADEIQDGIDYLLGIQKTDESDVQNLGGYGYMENSRADLSNTVMAIEALREAGLPADHEAIQRATKFVTRCQNNSETNDLEWALNDGGFIYRPGESKAGEITVDGKDGFRSYGIMSYAGFLSFVYADVGREDPRVKAAMDWIRSNYTVNENVNLGEAGLFYYYRLMSKALQTAEIDKLRTESGTVNWARDLSDKLISLQKDDGRWVNTNSQWMEDDFVLVTAYCVKALSYCYRALNGLPSEIKTPNDL
ncbi:MAG: prenyltransferase/squalene oxidase repeat-containing protein [Planctomycetota bacterium]|nr:prenyltransferase/squalene oxidase repeat-containing protein [Planctomycetota bacterium]